MPVHRRATDSGVDPEIASLARVKLGTWKVIAGVFAWLFALSGGVAANTHALTAKADDAVVRARMDSDRELLTVKLDAIDRRLQKIEDYQARQTQAAEQAAAVAAAMKDRGN